jgi:hypothetical protein
MRCVLLEANPTIGFADKQPEVNGSISEVFLSRTPLGCGSWWATTRIDRSNAPQPKGVRLLKNWIVNKMQLYVSTKASGRQGTRRGGCGGRR